MRRKQFSYLLTPAMMVFLLAAGCKTGNQRTPAIIDQTELSDRAGSIESFSQIYHLYPSPGEMIGIIDLEEMSYDGELLNPPENADKYLDTRSQTYMLGIYMTDLAYSALFGRHEATLDYLEVVRNLAEEIRIDRAVDDAMMEKAKNNVRYLDSLYNISNEAFMNILSFCEKNDRSNTIVMLSVGAFAESLYLAVNLIDNYKDADYLLQHLADQKYSIDNFMTFAEGVKEDDPNVSAAINDLKTIKTIYDGINPGTGAITVTYENSTDKQKAKKLLIGEGSKNSKPSLSPDDFEALKAAIVELRTKIIEG